MEAIVYLQEKQIQKLKAENENWKKEYNHLKGCHVDAFARHMKDTQEIRKLQSDLKLAIERIEKSVNFLEGRTDFISEAVYVDLKHTLSKLKSGGEW